MNYAKIDSNYVFLGFKAQKALMVIFTPTQERVTSPYKERPFYTIPSYSRNAFHRAISN